MARRIARISFEKLGDIKYISHLNLADVFERALRRAGAPLWYSEGFSPHPKLNFALPLSVGTESVCEMCDVSVTEDAAADCLDGLYSQTPSGIKVNKIEFDPEKKFSSIGFCSYELIFNNADPEALSDFFSKPIVVIKRSKKGDRETDVAPMIEERETLVRDGVVVLKLLLCAGGDRGYLNPELILKAMESTALKDAASDCRVIRTGVFDLDKKPFEED